VTPEQAIRDRLFVCIQETPETLKEIAATIGANYSYLSGLRSKHNPDIKASLIAAFCTHYHYSAEWIITGHGERKAQASQSQLDRIENTLDAIITSLLDSMLFSNHSNQMSDLQKLMNEARRRKN